MMLFQFHKGTIKTIIVSLFVLCLKDFNSIKVQLKPIELLILNLFVLHFNSIKVQLKHYEY